MFLSLGTTPLANGYLQEADLTQPEARYPLEVYFCETCHHCQLLDVVSPEVLFRNYLYASSTSDTLQQHFSDLADELIGRQSLGARDLVVEIASNDGILLKQFRGRGIRAVGVDPAANLAEMCRSEGLEVHEAFFNSETARLVAERYGKAKVITGSNVLGHVDELVDFITGIESLLTDDGLACLEVPHVLELVTRLEFDTIYHEHLSYFSVGSAATLLERAGLTLCDVQRIPIHGGTIRLLAKKRSARVEPSEELVRLLELEEAAGLAERVTFERFASRVNSVKDELLRLLKELRADGKRVAAYGAAAKGATLLNYCGIDSALLGYMVDKSPLKQELFAPGSHLPIVAPDKILQDMPDFLLLLAWNLSEEIIREQQEYLQRGGRFIIPVPVVHLAP